MIFELARESDWEEIKRISVQIHDLHAAWRPDIYFHCEEPYPKDSFLQNIQENLVYVVRQQGKVRGYVVFSILKKGGSGTVQSKQLRVESICVDEAFRGQGIGKILIAHSGQVAQSLCCESLVLGVHPENEWAIQFYQACGFSVRTVNMEKKV
jgi:ribosomal protein S18 acetylase RimI-like enzyme